MCVQRNHCKADSTPHDFPLTAYQKVAMPLLLLQFLFHLFLNVVYGRVQKSLKCSTFFLSTQRVKKVHIFLGTHNSYVWA